MLKDLYTPTFGENTESDGILHNIHSKKLTSHQTIDCQITSYLDSENDYMRFVHETQDGLCLFVRDFESEQCFFDLEQGV